MNGDGYGDLVVGSYRDTRADDGGAVYLYHGGTTGIWPASEQKLLPSDDDEERHFGSSVGSAGDVDGDGYDDLVVGAFADQDHGTYSGASYLYSGGPHGVQVSSETKLTPSDAGGGAYFGRSVAGAGDLNGDGYDDIVIGADGDDGTARDAGCVYAYHGGPSGVEAGTETRLAASDGLESGRFGGDVSGAGDVDSDGFADLLVGSSGHDDQTGSAYVYLGGATGVEASSEHRLWASDGTVLDLFGAAVSGAGDLDGDTFADVVVGAPWAAAAYVYYGGCRVDEDGDGHCEADDCDDLDATRHPGAAKTPDDGVDADCDGSEACLTDADDDGFTDGVSTVLSADADCGNAGEGSAADPTGDCDDGDADISPDATERCNGVDDDCDGAADEADAADARLWYRDADADGHGQADSAQVSCGQPEGYVAQATDCDDADPDTHPGATETPDDGVDQDCDGADAVSGVSAAPDAGEPGTGGCACGSAERTTAGWLGALLLFVRRRAGLRCAPQRPPTPVCGASPGDRDAPAVDEHPRPARRQGPGRP